ncbi:hypothetical protein MMC07_009394, partial [Pseudocyphellaria aurata]|nr:hypothetical protein [Pseudocyphellaria aurata]
ALVEELAPRSVRRPTHFLPVLPLINTRKAADLAELGFEPRMAYHLPDVLLQTAPRKALGLAWLGFEPRDSSHLSSTISSFFFFCLISFTSKKKDLEADGREKGSSIAGLCALGITEPE